MKRLIVAVALSTLIACGGEDAKVAEVAREKPLAQSKNSPEFNVAFGQFLETYYHLKDALVLTNDTLATTYAERLSAQADSVQLDGLKADKSIVEMSQGYLQSIATEAGTFAKAKTIDDKRKLFKTISEQMYDLVRTVQYDRAVVYHQYCPMAFNDAGAYWLSKEDNIKNPYFGKKMLTCGEVKDSIDYTK